MRILHVITTIELGGAEKQLLTLVRKQIESKNEVSIFYLKGLPELKDAFQELGVSVTGSPHFITSIFKFVTLRRRLLKNKDVIHAHLPAAELICALLQYKIPLVVSRHNAQPFYSDSVFISKLMTLLISKRARACIAISDAVKKYMIEKQEWTNSNSIFTVHYGFDDTYRPKVTRFKNDILNFLFIGRLVPQKDVPTLLKAFQINLQKYPFDKLTIVGGGPLSSELRQLCTTLRISHCINWIGRVSNVNYFYSSNDIFVLTSRYEGFGLVLLEALASNIPIIASNNSAVPEVLGNLHPALFATSNHAELANLMMRAHNSAFLDEIVRFQEFRKKLFNPQEMENQISKVYSFIVSPSHR